MKRLKYLRIAAVAAALTLMVLSGAPAHAGPPKVTICHVPPGNPGNAHTIRVNIHAWPAHQSHGDELGECNPTGDPDQGGDDGGGEDDDPGGDGDDGDDDSGGSGVSGSGSGSGAFEVVLCDGRKGEQGRRIQVTGTGRVAVQPAQCQ